MAGNVWEWTADWSGVYPQGVDRNPSGLSSGDDRVVLGGSQDYDANHSRAAFRTGFSPSHVDVDLGFRYVVSATP